MLGTRTISVDSLIILTTYWTLKIVFLEGLGPLSISKILRHFKEILASSHESKWLFTRTNLNHCWFWSWFSLKPIEIIRPITCSQTATSCVLRFLWPKAVISNRMCVTVCVHEPWVAEGKIICLSISYHEFTCTDLETQLKGQESLLEGKNLALQTCCNISTKISAFDGFSSKLTYVIIFIIPAQRTRLHLSFQKVSWNLKPFQKSMLKPFQKKYV